MWIGVLWAGLRVAMWIAHVGGTFRHGLLEKSLININFFVRLVLGRPRVCPGDFTGFVPGTNPVKTWDKPGFSPYLHSGSPISPGLGTNPVCPWDNPGDEGRHRKFM